MKSIQLDALSQYFPQLLSKSINELYQSSFEPQQIVLFFEGWEFYEPYNRYIDDTESRNIVWFNESTYCINGTELKWPATLNDFITDCHSFNVDLRWNPAIQERF
ncbi:hypothetical protein [Xanthocytophaga agilis]|uniref:Uncharacterized protein n=1 Tax=Xanthocytophaga agilis TaxID=3048010 RepID=A0AAE3UFK0_9BACT|nr:hypothetical protein [Xanthocytophaga agilis]MDJ1503340.1 hypothetical protein [Xanthocytophaga agilis]